MKNRIAFAATGAAFLTLCASNGASAQLNPTVATITVPVKIANLDAEWANQMFGAISVTCEVLRTTSPPTRPGSGADVVATGTQAIPFVETPATSTVRAMLNYNGPVVVQAHVTSVFAAGAHDGARASDPETAAQIAAGKAINEARSYGCFFTAAKGLATGGAHGSMDMESVLPKGYERGDAAEKGGVYFVSGTFSPSPRK